MTYNSNVYFYVKNLQGDIIGLVNTAGEMVVEYKYDAWEKVLEISGSLASTIGKKNPFRYRGYYYDSETEMYYLQSRYYDLEVKRFINADKIISRNGAHTKGCNVFLYCFNNPINNYDDSGNWLKGMKKVGKAIYNIGKSIVTGIAKTAYVFGKSVYIDVGAGLGLGVKTSSNVLGIKVGVDASVTLTNRFEINQYSESTKTVGANNINIQLGPSLLGYTASAEHTAKGSNCTCTKDSTYDEILACPERITNAGITTGYDTCLEYEIGLYVGIGMD